MLRRQVSGQRERGAGAGWRGPARAAPFHGALGPARPTGRCVAVTVAQVPTLAHARLKPGAWWAAALLATLSMALNRLHGGCAGLPSCSVQAPHSSEEPSALACRLWDSGRPPVAARRAAPTRAAPRRCTRTAPRTRCRTRPWAPARSTRWRSSSRASARAWAATTRSRWSRAPSAPASSTTWAPAPTWTSA